MCRYHDVGAGVVLLYASKYNDVKTVVNISGRYDLKAGIEERLGKNYMERIKEDGFIDVKRPGNLSFNRGHKFQLVLAREHQVGLKLETRGSHHR